MGEGKAKSLRVAAVQMESENGMIQRNLERATRLVEKAAGQGARLIVLPEFMPTGYIFTREIWEAGEPTEGPTVKWLRENSRRLGVWLGTSFLEAKTCDFFNTFVLTSPQGKEEGRVRKQTPAFAEAFFFRGSPNRHVIDTELGRIGVGICYENLLAYTPRLMCEQDIDLLIMPHSAPSPTPSLLFPRRQVQRYNLNLKNLAAYYGKMLGVPVILVNKAGSWRSPLPLLPFLPQESSFPGLSTIVDSDGEIRAQLGEQEGIIVEEVKLDPRRKTLFSPPPCGRWSLKVPWAMKQFVLVEAVGGFYYRVSVERRRRAKMISSTGKPA